MDRNNLIKLTNEWYAHCQVCRNAEHATSGWQPLDESQWTEEAVTEGAAAASLVLENELGAFVAYNRNFRDWNGGVCYTGHTAIHARMVVADFYHATPEVDELGKEVEWSEPEWADPKTVPNWLKQAIAAVCQRADDAMDAVFQAYCDRLSKEEEEEAKQSAE